MAYTLTLDDIRQRPDLRRMGAYPGDEIAEDVDGNLELVRVWSDGSESVPDGHVVTQEDIDANESLRNYEAEVGDIVTPDMELFRTNRANLLRNLELGFDEGGNDVTDWAVTAEAHFPLGNWDTFLNPEAEYGAGFSEASIADRKRMILAAKERELIEEYGYATIAPPSMDSVAQGVGAFGKAVATPTSAVPLGRSFKWAVGSGAVLGAEASVGQQLAREDEVDLGQVATAAVIGGALGGTVQAAPGGVRRVVDFAGARRQQSLLRNADNVMQRSQAAVNSGRAQGLEGKELTEHVIRTTNTSLEDIELAQAATGIKLRLPGSTERAEEAVRLAVTEDAGVTRRYTRAATDTARATAKGVDDVLGAISTRVKAIDEGIFGRLMRFEANSAQNLSSVSNKISPFVESLTKMTEYSRNKLNQALMNQDFTAARNMMKVQFPEMIPQFDEVIKVLGKVGNDLKEVGHNFDSIVDYFPRIVKDLDGLRTALDTTYPKGFVDQQLRIYAKANKLFDAQGRPSIGKIPADRTASIFDKLTRGYRLAANPKVPGGVSYIPSSKMVEKGGTIGKQRVLEKVPEGLLKFYHSPEESLQMYLTRAVNDIERRKLLDIGKRTAKSAKVGREDAFTGTEELDGSIGTYFEDAHRQGRITSEQKDELVSLFRDRLIGGEQSMGSIASFFRDTGYAETIANPFTAIIQYGDLAASGKFYGMRNTLASMFGTKDMKLIDLGLERTVAQELTGKGMSSALEKLLNWSGFKAIDRFGKETIINAALKRGKQLANTPKGVAELRKKYAGMMGEADFNNMVDDLANGRVTGDTKFFAFTELSKLQPISMSEMPAAYNRNPNWRLAYALKAYTLKQYDVLRREAVQEFKNADTAADKVKAIANGASIIGWLAVGNASVGAVRDLALGREVDPEQFSDRLVSSALGTYGFNRYTMDRYLKRGDVVGGVTNMLVPSTAIIETPFKVLSDALSEEGIKEDEEALQYLKQAPIFGTFVYNWFGGGAEKYDETYNRD